MIYQTWFCNLQEGHQISELEHYCCWASLHLAFLTIFPWKDCHTSVISSKPLIFCISSISSHQCVSHVKSHSEFAKLKSPLSQDWSSRRLCTHKKSSYPWSWCADPFLVAMWESSALLWLCKGDGNGGSSVVIPLEFLDSLASSHWNQQIQRNFHILWGKKRQSKTKTG